MNLQPQEREHHQSQGPPSELGASYHSSLRDLALNVPLPLWDKSSATKIADNRNNDILVSEMREL